MHEMSIPFIFLLGAGASKKAGVPLIDEMTKKFEKQLQDIISLYLEDYDELRDNEFHELLLDSFNKLKSSIQKSPKKFDVEILLEALTKLSDPNEVFHIIRPEENNPYQETYYHLKTILMKFIREKCEKIEDISYLYPLKGFIDFVGERGIDIFTLNYDGAIEAMCEKSQIPYRDGFYPYWAPEEFDKLKKGIRIYKIHGSLFWFKAGRIYVKIPIININPERVRYFTGEEAVETIIYPLITKEMYTGPFPWLLQEFKDKLLNTENCIVIGYSFRDEAIRKILLEQMESNPELWLYLVDPNGVSVKKRILDLYPSFSDRIVVLEAKCEDAFMRRVLLENIRTLRNARQSENQAWSNLFSSSQLRSEGWEGVISQYRHIKHFDRIKSTIEKVMEYEYKTRSYSQRPFERLVIDVAIRFGVEYMLDGDKEKAKFWLRMFRDYWAAIEYGREGQKYGLSPPHKMPHWYDPQRSIDELYEDGYRNLEKEIKDAIKKIPENNEAKQILQVMLQNLDMYWRFKQRGPVDGYFEFVKKGGNQTLFQLSQKLIRLNNK